MPPEPTRTELLSPAGDWEALRAAVAGGADAVYFGLSNYNARHRATNFSVAELPQVIEFFTSLGIPAPGFTATAIASLEFLGGILLIIGLGSRLIGLLLACNMFVAYVTADREALFSFFKDPGKFYVADPFTFLFISLIIVVFGAGFFSLDAFIARRRTARAS